MTKQGAVSVRRQTAVESIVEAGVFDEAFYRQQVPDLPASVDPIEHYVTKGAPAGLNPSSMFHTAYYKKMNPAARRKNPLAHYCEYGWQELRNPSPLFNTWWYWFKHLDPSDTTVNPLAHYESVGREQGLSIRPDQMPSRRLGGGFRPDPGRPMRRVCLFAAYDGDGIVDEYVVDYVRELSRHADVYYLADAEMKDSELAKLAEITRGAWGVRHGEYDFGSYSRLAEMVGWDTIEEYDELLLVNDSCYLLRSLDEVFARMDSRGCDWWGLQSTKGIYSTRLLPVNQFRDPLPMESVRTALVDAFEQDYTYDFLLGSFFLAYRKPVIADPEFRRYLGSVTKQRTKRDIILKYEIGMTRWLIQHGHSFDTFAANLYPFHPVFTKWYFRLLDEGFPLLKRYFLSENHYHVPRLFQWPELIRSRFPGVDTGVFERNLVRVTDPEKLHRSLHIGEDTEVDDAPVSSELLSIAEFVEADINSPKHPDWWAFPVDEYTGVFSGNERAIFEVVRDDPSIRKIILTREAPVTAEGVNVEVVPLESPRGQHLLMRAGTILIKQNRDSSVRYPVSSELHNLIQVWHGIPFKRIGYASADFQGMLERIAYHHAHYRAVISSSKVDRLAMTASFYPLTFHQIWNTGLPRNDFILRDEDQLPDDYRTELDKLRTLVGDRRLVLFMPTFRNAQSEGYYRFAPDEIAWLDSWLHTNNCVLGVREHMADSARLYSAQLTGLPILDLSDREFSHVEMLYRASTALVTDYSSAFIDYMLTDKPAISFAYDYESYLMERGGFYDLDMIVPGPICKSFRRPPDRVGASAGGRDRQRVRPEEATVLRPRRRPQLRPRRREDPRPQRCPRPGNLDRGAKHMSRQTEGSHQGTRSMASRIGGLVSRLARSRGESAPNVERTGAQAGRPRLVDFVSDGSGVRLNIGVSAALPSDPVLLLVGRKSGLEVRAPLTKSGPGWSVRVVDDDLSVFEVETVDLFVIGPEIGGAGGRRRLRSGGVQVRSAPESVRRWYETADGNVSVRRPTAAEVIVEAGVFDEAFYRRQVPDLPADVDAVQHYVTEGVVQGLNPSSMFETAYYQKMNPSIRRRNPLAHYCESGWRDLRNPSPLFNTWWYWSKHLDPADDSVNPLAHYESVGKEQGLSTHPDRTPSRRLGGGFRPDPMRPMRRVCLFAAYDGDGIVDEYVVDYVRELSRHADVYYLADAEMKDSELAKLAEITRGAWGVRHGEYDFGSYSRLAEMVGWDTIEEYDELLLVNDSCYLLRSLDEVFARMDSRSCDWWGLQSTKGIGPTRWLPVNQFRDPLPMESVRTALVDAFEQDYTYDFHVASFFLAYRKPVIADPEFRRYLGSVTSQTDKFFVILKYEIGMTHWLIQHGHSFDNFLSRLYPFHGSYTKWYSRLLDEGFPLLKRRFLADNPFRVPRLVDWTKLVQKKVPGVDTGVFERNLVRVTDPEKLHRSLHIGEDTEVDDAPVSSELLSIAEFVEADINSPKHPDWWAFPVDEYTGVFSGNERAIFEVVRDDPSIRKIILTREAPVTAEGVNVEVVPLESPRGQHLLMRAGTILIKQNRDSSVRYPVSSELHNLIQVRDSIPLRRTGFASAGRQLEFDLVTQEQAGYRAVISSSKVDRLAMTASFYPLTFHQIWNTGLPRNDFILRDEDQLPDDYRTELDKLRTLVGDRRLVLFMPTFRNAQSEGYYRFAPDEIAWLDSWLHTNNCVLGVREHMADSARLYSAQLTGLPILDLSDREFSHVEMLYRASTALVTDYSSAFIDYMLTDKPAISFAYDYESYLMERGGFYDLELAFPGPICRSFAELRSALGPLIRTRPDESYEFCKRLFFDHVDDHSSARVVEKIRDLNAVHGIGKLPDEHVA